MPLTGDLTFMPYVATLVKEGYSGRGAMAWLRDQGLKFSNESFWTVWREEAMYEKGTWRASRLPEDRPPPDDLVQRSERYVLSEYTYRFYAESIDERTGERESRAIHLGLEKKVSIEEARAILEKRLEDYPEDYPLGIVLGSFSGAFSRA